VSRLLYDQRMKDPQLEVLAAELKALKSRVGALEKLLERMLRQKPVSEKQLEKALRARTPSPADLSR
jgi:hypothetical protein